MPTDPPIRWTRGDKRLIQIDPGAQPHVLLLNRSLAVEMGDIAIPPWPTGNGYGTEGRGLWEINLATGETLPA